MVLWLLLFSVELLQSFNCVYTLLNQNNNKVCIKFQKANIIGREFLVSKLILRQIFIRIWVDTELSLDIFLSFTWKNFLPAKRETAHKRLRAVPVFSWLKAISYSWSQSQGICAAVHPESFFSSTCNLEYDSKEWYSLWYQRRQVGKNALFDHMAKKCPRDIMMSQHYRVLEFDNENAAARHW